MLDILWQGWSYFLQNSVTAVLTPNLRIAGQFFEGLLGAAAFAFINYGAETAHSLSFQSLALYNTFPRYQA